MHRFLSALERLGGKVLAVAVGSLAGVVIGAALGYAAFLLGELLAETFFGFEGWGDLPSIDMSPRSRLRGGFLILGALAGIPLSWVVMRRMEKRDEAAGRE